MHLTKDERFKLQTKLDVLFTDFQMLADGSWEPDESSIAASTEVVEEIAELCEIIVSDTRDLEDT